MTQLSNLMDATQREIAAHEETIRTLQQQLNAHVQALVFARGKLSGLEALSESETNGDTEEAQTQAQTGPVADATELADSDAYRFGWGAD